MIDRDLVLDLMSCLGRSACPLCQRLSLSWTAKWFHPHREGTDARYIIECTHCGAYVEREWTPDTMKSLKRLVGFLWSELSMVRERVAEELSGGELEEEC